MTRTWDLRFVDPAAARVVATTELPGSPSALVLTGDRRTLYVVTRDFWIAEVDAETHEVVRAVPAWEQERKEVHWWNQAAISADGRRLIVGLSSSTGYPNDTLSLRLFDLPDLTSSQRVPLPGYAHLAPAQSGGLFTWQWEDSVLYVVRPEYRDARPLLHLDGPIRRVTP